MQSARRERCDHGHHPRDGLPRLPREPPAPSASFGGPRGAGDCLVQPKFAAARLGSRRGARGRRSQPRRACRTGERRHHPARPRAGRSAPRSASTTTEIWHLAAVYDLSVARDLALRVNVEGTRNVLRFAEDCPGLRRHHYVSTCYVSGRYCGPFRESDLDVGQSFNNFYEETKFLAEVEVAESRSGGMPTSVYRPAVVVGDSITGETQKFDGPYFLLQWLLRQPRWALVPVVGDPTMSRFNMVPSDFVIDAIEHLSGLDVSVGRTYQLADPRPLTVDQLLDEMCRATARRGVRVHLPRRATEWALRQHRPVGTIRRDPGRRRRVLRSPHSLRHHQHRTGPGRQRDRLPSRRRLPPDPGRVHAGPPRGRSRCDGLATGSEWSCGPRGEIGEHEDRRVPESHESVPGPRRRPSSPSFAHAPRGWGRFETWCGTPSRCRAEGRDPSWRPGWTVVSERQSHGARRLVGVMGPLDAGSGIRADRPIARKREWRDANDRGVLRKAAMADQQHETAAMAERRPPLARTRTIALPQRLLTLGPLVVAHEGPRP